MKKLSAHLITEEFKIEKSIQWNKVVVVVVFFLCVCDFSHGLHHASLYNNNMHQQQLYSTPTEHYS